MKGDHVKSHERKHGSLWMIKKKVRLRLKKSSDSPSLIVLWTSGSAHSKFLFFFLRLTQELLLSQSLFPPLRLPHPGHNAQSPLQPLRNTIDYMVFTPLRAGGQGSPCALKPKSPAHCPAKGEKAGGKAQPTFRGLIPACKKKKLLRARRSQSPPE